MPKKDRSKKKKFVCQCGYVSEDMEDAKIKETVESEAEIEVVNPDQDLESLPITDIECPTCKNKKAYFWLVQTRAADEPETKFLKCTKCRHTWRDYS